MSRLATAALVEELDRRSKIEALDVYLATLEADLGPISSREQADATRWVERVLTPPAGPEAKPHRRRSA